jgi:hypothetical protein
VKELLRGDAKQRSFYYTSGINAGWLTRNEARTSEGLDPIDGLDEPLRPLNMVEEGEDPATVADQADTEADSEDGPTKPAGQRLCLGPGGCRPRCCAKSLRCVARPLPMLMSRAALRSAYLDRTRSLWPIASPSLSRRLVAIATQQLELVCAAPEGRPLEQFEMITRTRLERLALGAQP